MLKTVKTDEIPQRSRKVESRFEKTPEWKEIQAGMKKGIKAGASLQLTLSDEEKAEYGIKNRRTIARFLEKYIEADGLEYTIRTFQREGLDYVVIDGPPGTEAAPKKAKGRSAKA